MKGNGMKKHTLRTVNLQAMTWSCFPHLISPTYPCWNLTKKPTQEKTHLKPQERGLLLAPFVPRHSVLVPLGRTTNWPTQGRRISNVIHVQKNFPRHTICKDMKGSTQGRNPLPAVFVQKHLVLIMHSSSMNGLTQMTSHLTAPNVSRLINFLVIWRSMKRSIDKKLYELSW